MSSITDADTMPPDALNLPQSASEQDQQTEPVANPAIGPDGLPILQTFPATDNDTRAEALHIIADSVAQQRNMGSRAVIFHPIAAAIIVAAMAAVWQAFTDKSGTNYVKVFTTAIGVLMAFLGGIRLCLGPYIFEAEKVGTWKWLDTGRSPEEEQNTGVKVLGDTDEILLTKFGEEYIGAIIFRGTQPIVSPASPSGNKKGRRANSPSKHTRMVIRGWSVRQKYRRKEVGTALLEDAIKIGHEKGWTADGVEFAADHANSKRVLPAIFNGPFDKFESIAQKTLDKKLQEFQAPDKGRKRK